MQRHDSPIIEIARRIVSLFRLCSQRKTAGVSNDLIWRRRGVASRNAYPFIWLRPG